jgi:hypothetical protein
MAKTCNVAGCSNPQFGGFKCKYHQYMRHMRNGDLFKPKKRQGAPPKESKKRKEEKKYYTQHCKELEQEIRAKNNGKIYCFFSGLEINERITWHHLKTRTGKFYTDKEWLVPAINQYHIDYHFRSVEWLIQQFWYEGFLNRLKDKSLQLYYKEITKQEKAELEFEE